LRAAKPQLHASGRAYASGDGERPEPVRHRPAPTAAEPNA
jgi:hypothetical protein